MSGRGAAARRNVEARRLEMGIPQQSGFGHTQSIAGPVQDGEQEDIFIDQGDTSSAATAASRESKR